MRGRPVPRQPAPAVQPAAQVPQHLRPYPAERKHVTVRLIDFEDVERNQYVVTTQYAVRSGAEERRADVVLLVNGLPLVVVEAKTPVRASRSWVDGAAQVRDDYERAVPELFVPNLCSAAVDGKELRYGSVGLPVDLWGPWRTDDADADAPARNTDSTSPSCRVTSQPPATPALRPTSTAAPPISLRKTGGVTR